MTSTQPACLPSLLALGLLASVPAGAHAEPSAWSASRYASARLIDGGVARPDGDHAPGGRLAGVEIRLVPPFITYWRNPGDAGVPPVFDFTGSDNLGAAQVLYPAPRRLDEAGAVAFGYSGTVMFPVEVVPKDPGRPVTLDLRLDYAVCAEICVPAKAQARLTLGTGSPAETEAVRQAVATVPVRRTLGESGPVRIDDVVAEPGGTARVETSVPPGEAALFAEAPDPWYVATSAAHEETGGHVGFTVSLPAPRPPEPLPAGPVRLTLTSAAGAIEVAVPFDALLGKP